ncbi:MAG: hypothetical protein ACLRSW_00225 [Christensenellaceae bacterium]
MDGKILIALPNLCASTGSPGLLQGKRVLQRKAERGTLIHEEIERYIKHGELGFTSEQDDFINFAKELGLKNMRSEQIVNDDLVAGTVDLMAERVAGKVTIKVLADYKTGTAVDKEAVRWQLSLYERLSGEKFDEFYVFHLCEKSKYIPLEHIPAEEISCPECERKVRYTSPARLWCRANYWQPQNKRSAPLKWQRQPRKRRTPAPQRYAPSLSRQWRRRA